MNYWAAKRSSELSPCNECGGCQHGSRAWFGCPDAITNGGAFYRSFDNNWYYFQHSERQAFRKCLWGSSRWLIVSYQLCGSQCYQAVSQLFRSSRCLSRILSRRFLSQDSLKPYGDVRRRNKVLKAKFTNFELKSQAAETLERLFGSLNVQNLPEWTCTLLGDCIVSMLISGSDVYLWQAISLYNQFSGFSGVSKLEILILKTQALSWGCFINISLVNLSWFQDSQMLKIDVQSEVLSMARMSHSIRVPI